MDFEYMATLQPLWEQILWIVYYALTLIYCIFVIRGGFKRKENGDIILGIFFALTFSLPFITHIITLFYT